MLKNCSRLIASGDQKISTSFSFFFMRFTCYRALLHTIVAYEFSFSSSDLPNLPTFLNTLIPYKLDFLFSWQTKYLSDCQIFKTFSSSDSTLCVRFF